MSQGNTLVTALGATMALMLVSRGLRGSRFSMANKAWMALAWLGLIVGGCLVAAWWHQ